MQTEQTNELKEYSEVIRWLNDESLQILNKGYLLKGETPYTAMQRIARAGQRHLIGTPLYEESYDKFMWLMVSGILGISSPIWANMGTQRGLPISCFNVHLTDSILGITNKLGEVITQTKIGGGTSGYFGELRPRGSEIKNNGKSSGAVSFMQLFDTSMNVVSQGSTRRGSFAAYLDIDHADVQEFLNIKDIGSPIQNLFFGVNVTHEWMDSMIAGDIEKRKTWARVLESRQQKGLPYIFFTDNVNDGRPQIYKDREAVVKSSNLCAEIALPSTAEESFVCCLSSMNLELYDEWKDTDAIFWSVVLLDTVMSEFIEKTEEMPYMEATNKFAKRHRAIGLGVLGYHSLLQKKGLPFGSFEASRLNNKIFKQLKEQSYEASEKLGEILGVAPIFGEGETTDVPRRNSTLNAIAPTTSNSAILGQLSPGIEPSASNYFKVGLAKGNFMRKNKYLQPILAERGFDNDETWRSIMLDNGSVMNLPKEVLSDEEKQVFLTFREISPMDIITTASQRQKYIDQAQSINLQIPSTMPVKDVNFLYMEAWKKGIKTLYYQRSSSVSKEMMVKFVSCSGCEG